MRFPLDLDEDFKPTWDAFLELHAVQDALAYNPLAIEDAFRLLLLQAGAKSVKTLYTVKRFVSVDSVIRLMRRQIDLTHVFNYMGVIRHDISYSLPVATQINIISNPVISGIVELKPRGFTLDYLLGRMESLKVFRSGIPEQLAGAKQKPTRFNIRDRDWFNLYRDKEFEMSLCRLRNGRLLLSYGVALGTVIPSYKDAEKQLNKIWKTAIAGVIPV